jgi:hypothetical protein
LRAIEAEDWVKLIQSLRTERKMTKLRRFPVYASAFSLILFVISAATSSAQTLQIEYPGNDSLLYEGQTYTILVTVGGAVQNIYVLTQPPLPAAQPTSVPTQFTLTLPTNIPPGLYSIAAVGSSNGSDIESAPVMADIERQDLPTSLTAQPTMITFQSIGDQHPILVWGTYSDGTTMLVSNSLLAHWSSNNTGVATVPFNGFYGNGGFVTSASVGQAAITVGTYPYAGPQSPSAIAAVLVQVLPGPPTGTAPTITAVSPTNGTPGVTDVTIKGANFGTSQGNGFVQLGTLNATVNTWTPTKITATVVPGSASGVAMVNQNGLSSNEIAFATQTPAITGVKPTLGYMGTPVTIKGTNFGTTQGNSTVMFNRAAATVSTWNATQITTTVPAGATTGNIVAIVNGVPSNPISFTAPPKITGITPPTQSVGGTVAVAGSNFGTVQGSSTVTFNGIAGTSPTWGAGSISVPVPTGATTGPVVVTVNGVVSNSFTLTVTP